MNVNANDPKIIVALDYPDASSAHAMAARLDPAQALRYE